MECEIICSKENDLVLSAKDAAFLVTKREHLGKLVVSVKGTITALSDEIRVGKDRTCMVEVDQCIILVLKDFHLEWYPKLEPGALFVFYNLRLTTLEKGVSKPCSVFFVLRTSVFSRLTDGNTITSVSLQEWMKQKCADISLVVETFGQEVDCEEHQELFNYEGIVTSTEMASSGIFVLDNKFRLVSLLTSVKIVKKNSRVFVYNVHIFKDGGWLYLVCCMKSCIRIHDADLSIEDTADSSTCTAEVEDSAGNKVQTFIENFIIKYGLNLREITTLLQLYNTIVGRQGRSRNYQENIFVHFLKGCVGTIFVKSPVKATDVFIYHHQHCPLNSSQSDRCRIPQVVDIHSLIEETVKMQSSVGSDNCRLTESGLQFESSPHHFKLCSPDGKVLVGTILTCPEGIILQDVTGQLRVILLSESDVTQSDKQSDGHPGHVSESDTADSIQQSHICRQRCFEQCHPGTQLTCPVLDPRMIGMTISVGRFNTIMESSDVKSPDVINKSNATSGKVSMYLTFCLLDCVLMDKMADSSSVGVDSALTPLVNVGSTLNPSVNIGSVSNPPLNVHSSPTLSLCNPSRLSGQEHLKEVKKCDSVFTCYIYVTEKQPLTYTDNQYQNAHSFQFRILGNIIDPDIEKSKIMKRNKSFNVRNTSSNICHLENTAPTQHKHRLTDSCKISDFVTKLKSVCASFSDRSSIWYSCINNGNLYKFTSKSNSGIDPFIPKYSQIRLQKLAEDCKVTITIQMPEDVLVERLSLDVSEAVPGFYNVNFTQQVSQILSERCSETVVSFQGVIINREFAKSIFDLKEERNGSKSQLMKNIKLDVNDSIQDTNGTIHSIAVYIDAPKTVYTLGLVPGAVVKFHNVERKVSQADKIYCRFNATSVAEVVKFHSLKDSSRHKFLKSEAQNYALKNVTEELLINIWECSVEESQRRNQTFRIRCHIEKIFQLRVKSVCSFCKSVYFKQGCHSRHCGSLSYPVPSANAVLLVEDGTCPATVKIWDSNIVCQLLTLTNTQWDDLIAAVLEHGEVLIDFKSTPVTPIAKFLHSLIGSSLILRQCKMDVRRSKDNRFSSFDKIPLEGYQENFVKVGKHSLKTLSLPRVQLECLMISEVV